MLYKISKNIFINTKGSDDYHDYMESNNALKVISHIQHIDETFFRESVYVINWEDDAKGVKHPEIERFQNKILLWIGEEESIFPSNETLSFFDIVFKEYLTDSSLLEHVKSDKVFPMPLLLPDNIPLVQGGYNNRKYNVFFRGNLNDNRILFYLTLKIRFSLLKRIVNFIYKRKPGIIVRGFRYFFRREDDLSNIFKNSIIKFNNGFNKGYTPNEYMSILQNSKIVLSPKGFNSAECFRLYEAMMAGAVVVTERLPSHEFYQNIPVIQVDSWDDIEQIINSLLKKQDDLEQMSKLSTSYFSNLLSNEAIARYIVKIYKNYADNKSVL